MRGYTLVELLVVVAIIAIISTVVFANYRDFSKDQILVKATGQIQSLLRLAQTNASSGLKCGADTATEWYVKFDPDKNHIRLFCQNSAGQVEITSKIITLDTDVANGVSVNEITFDAGSGCPSFSSANSFTVSYKPVFGQISFVLGRGGVTECVVNSVAQKASVKIKYTKNSVDNFKTFNINRGGAIDGQ